MSRLAFAVAVVVLLLPQSFSAKSRKKIPVAPLPAAVVNAKKILLANGGGSNLAYDAFYSEIKEWGKYELAGSPDQADLIVELAYRVADGGTRVWSSTDSFNHTTQIHSTRVLDPQLIVTIYESKTKASLWSETDHRRLARLGKNREKEMVNSAHRLVDDLRTRVSISQ